MVIQPTGSAPQNPQPEPVPSAKERSAAVRPEQPSALPPEDVVETSLAGRLRALHSRSVTLQQELTQSQVASQRLEQDAAELRELHARVEPDIRPRIERSLEQVATRQQAATALTGQLSRQAREVATAMSNVVSASVGEGDLVDAITALKLQQVQFKAALKATQAHLQTSESVLELLR